MLTLAGTVSLNLCQSATGHGNMVEKHTFGLMRVARFENGQFQTVRAQL